MLQRATNNQTCRDDEFKCLDGECISNKWRCDGFSDCRDRSDELSCSKCEIAGQFFCGNDVCIDKRHVCDGLVDCRDARDERLCLRLADTTNQPPVAVDLKTRTANASGINLARTTARRLEIWNATSSSWAPVCGRHWQATPMSDQACKALGYDRANETLVRFGNDTTVGRGRGQQRAPSLGRPPEASRGEGQLFVQPTAPDVPYSLESLMRFGTQNGCELEQSLSTVHLSCLNFQCGRSVTSYLSRLDMGAAWSTGADLSPNLTNRRPDRTPAQMSRDDGQPAARSSHFLGPRGGSAGASIEAADEDYSGDDGLASEVPLGEIDADDDLAGARSSAASARLIVGGMESMPGEFPYLAALHGGPNEVFFCGGVLISANWLLTAAHCVGNRTRPEGWMVKVGVTRRIASPAFVRKLKVRRIIKHQMFNKGGHLNNDIALILLDELVDFNQYLRPICLPPAQLKLGPDSSKDCVVVGFGKSRFSQDASYLHVAHFVNVPIIHRNVCSKWYSEQGVNLTEGMLCAGYSEGKRDACQGDSGSGLFCRQPNTNHFFVAGLVSFGVQCARPKLPGVYSSIPHYVDWIVETTRANGHPMA